MSRWVIYDKSGGVRAASDGLGTAGEWTLPELEYSGEWMGETFVTLNVRCAVPIEFEIGDYVVYRGEKFVMNYDPTVVKKARRGSYGEGFVYDNVKFNSLGYELTVARMLDYVLYGNDVHYSSLPKFSFFCTDVEDLADRLQVNMNRYCADNGFAVEDYWLFLTPSESATVLRALSYGLSERVARDRWAAASFSIVGAKVNQNVSIDNMSVWDSLKFIKDTFGLNFVVRGRSVVVGSAGLPTEDIFEYGKGKGLYEIERTADSEQQIVTKLFAYGSGKNLPVRYYADLNLSVFANVADIESSSLDFHYIQFHLDLDFDRKYFTFRSKTQPGDEQFPNFVVRMTARGFTVKGFVTLEGDTGKCRVYCEYKGTQDDDRDEPDVNMLDNFIGALTAGDRIYFESGVEKDAFPSANKDYAGGSSALPNNMAVQVLMLPGFPSQSLYDWVITPVVNGGGGGTAVSDTHNTNEFARARWTDDEGEVYDAFFSKVALKPFVISPNFIALGIREATKYFDGSDGEEEIFPTIEGIPGKNIVLHSDVIEDNGVFGEDVESIANFNIYLPDFGSDFDLAALLQGDTAIEMKSGYCGGRAFKVHSVERVGSGWKCNCERELDSDLSIYFPYSHNASIGETPIADEAYQVRGSDIPNYEGDRYVLTGIEMTSTYVDAASVRLLKYSLRFLSKNDYTRYTFVPKVDEIFMARQHDFAVASRETEQVVKSYYETLKEGDILLFRDTDLGISYETSGSDASVFIDTLRIKEYGNGQIPTYDVTLRDDKQVGTIQRLQEKVSSLSSSLSGGGAGGTNIPQVQSLIKTYGKELFLSKVGDDTASGVISFLKGALFGEGSAWGYVKQVAGEVRSWFKNLATDILTVTGHVKGNSNGELIIDDDLYVNGSGGFDGDLSVVDGSVNADKIIANDGKFSGTITTKNLTVTGLAHFFELVIDKIRSAGGAQIFSPAEGFKVEAVNRIVHQGMVRRRLWWRASDGGTTTSNMWRAGDQAICKNFNDIFQPGSYQEVGNKSYWAVVAWADSTSANSTPTWDATNPAYVAGAPNPYEVTKWHYIDIYADDEGMPIPVDADGKPLWEGAPWAAAAGDDVAMLGHRRTGQEEAEEARKRGNALYICAYKSIDTDLEAPLIAYYEGIDDFNLTSHRTTYKDADSGVWVGSMRVIVEGTSTDIVAYISSQLELTENHFMTQISTLPISRNLLLNTDFLSIDSVPQERAGLPTYWDRWNSMLDFEVRTVPLVKWKEAYIKPGVQFNGIMQDSKVLSGGVWTKVLKHGGTYTLSFWARLPENLNEARADILLHVYKVYDDGSISIPAGEQPSASITLSNTRDWVRGAVQFTVNPPEAYKDLNGYAFRVMIGCMHASVPTDEAMIVSRIQLEESVPRSSESIPYTDTATEWHRGEENSEIMSSQIKQTADEISLAVKVDGKKRAGVTLNSNGVTIDGDKLHFNGTINDEVTIEGANLHILNDIDLQGLTTENVTPVERTFPELGEYPYVINMGIGASNQNEVVKSVRVKACNESGLHGNSDGASCPIVVLPFYDSRMQYWEESEWFPKDTSITDESSPLYGSFFMSETPLLTENGGTKIVPDYQRRVVAWKKSGTRITITNEDDIYARNWRVLESWSYENGYYLDLLSRCVLVCADGRLITQRNIKSSGVQWKGTSEATDPVFYGGCFSCGGYAPRFILVAPGQTLQLRSQIVSVNAYTEVLVWVVENSSEFVPMGEGGNQFPVRFDNRNNPSVSDCMWVRNYGVPAYNVLNSNRAEKECLLAPLTLKKSYWTELNHEYGGFSMYKIYEEP